MHNRVSRCWLVAMIVCSTATLVTGAPIDDFLKAEKWYVQYEVSFKVANSFTEKNGPATTKTSINMNRNFSALCALDMRMDGPSMTLNSAMLSGTADGTKASMADQMKFSQDIMARMSTAANWMASGGMLSIDENASDADQQAAMAAAMTARLGPASMDCTRIDSSWGLVTEMGTPFNQVRRITWNGNGMVSPGGGSDPLLEIDGPSASYTLALPYVFGDMDTKMKQRTTTTDTDINWKNPQTSTDSNTVGMSLFPANIEVDDRKYLQAAGIVIRGKVDPSTGKIAGEHSVAAHYDDQAKSIPGTIHIRYTLTLTPPAKSK